MSDNEPGSAAVERIHARLKIGNPFFFLLATIAFTVAGLSADGPRMKLPLGFLHLLLGLWVVTPLMGMVVSILRWRRLSVLDRLFTVCLVVVLFCLLPVFVPWL